jgi:hypothetical protein
MPIIQNFSVAAGDDLDINFVLDPNSGLDLTGADIYWNVYEQAYGIPDSSTPPVIVKSTPADITIGSPADNFTVTLIETDTENLLRNYYHEAHVVDVNGNTSTVTVGIMTVTQTEIRSSP